MAHKFQPGDRVRVYLVYGTRFCFKGTIDSLHPSGKIRVIEDGFNSVHEEGPFHPKSCRRLVKKTPKRVWIDDLYLNDPRSEGIFIRKDPTPGYIEFIEVKKK